MREGRANHRLALPHLRRQGGPVHRVRRACRAGPARGLWLGAHAARSYAGAAHAARARGAAARGARRRGRHDSSCRRSPHPAGARPPGLTMRLCPAHGRRGPEAAPAPRPARPARGPGGRARPAGHALVGPSLVVPAARRACGGNREGRRESARPRTHARHPDEARRPCRTWQNSPGAAGLRLAHHGPYASQATPPHAPPARKGPATRPSCHARGGRGPQASRSPRLRPLWPP